jgi:hypothetical protein
MLNKQHSTLIALTILIALVDTPKPLSALSTTQSSSRFISLSDQSAQNSQEIQKTLHTYVATNLGAVNIADANNQNATSQTKKNHWVLWLLPLIIIVPFLGWFLLIRNSDSSEQPRESNNLNSLEPPETTNSSSPIATAPENLTEIYSDSDSRLNNVSSNVNQQVSNTVTTTKETVSESTSKLSDQVSSEATESFGDLFDTITPTSDHLREETVNLDESIIDLNEVTSEQKTNLMGSLDDSNTNAINNLRYTPTTTQDKTSELTEDGIANFDELFDLLDNPNQSTTNEIEESSSLEYPGFFDLAEETTKEENNLLGTFAEETDNANTELNDSNFQFLDDLLENNTNINEEKKS